jgi:predicted tellurium resistance membrane protein TerC
VEWFSWVSDPQAWIALATLLALEIVLGIDNIVFISILAGKLPQQQQGRAIYTGLLLAMATRVALLFSIAWLVGLTEPLFSVLGLGLSGRDLILLAGGLFLIYKAVSEIHDKLEGEEGHGGAKVAASFAAVIGQILILDIVFSLDSVITAVGMADDIAVMVIAVIVAILIMLAAAKPIVAFVERHPTVKMLALSFLILIGVSLVAEGLHQHIPKGYIYFSMAFAVMVEFLNLRTKTKAGQPVTFNQPYLNQRYVPEGAKVGVHKAK